MQLLNVGSNTSKAILNSGQSNFPCKPITHKIPRTPLLIRKHSFSIYLSMLAQVEDSSLFSSSDSATQISSFSLSAPSTQPSSFSSSDPRAQLGSASLPEYLEKGVQVEVKDLRELLPLIPHERLMGTEASQKRFDWERRVDHILGLGPECVTFSCTHILILASLTYSFQP